MPTCEIVGSDFGARLTYTVTQDVAQNLSVVRITNVAMRSVLSSWVTRSCRVQGFININGSTAVKMEYTNSASTGIIMSNTYANVSGVYSTYDRTVNHGEDGSAVISVYANLSVYSNDSGSLAGAVIMKTISVALPQIPRVSTLTAAGVELGQEMTIGITRAAESFTDTVVWRCGSQSGTIAENTQLTSLHWTPPLELASQAPEDTQVPVVLTLTTFTGGTQVGTRKVTVSCTLPKSMVPTLSAAVEDGKGLAENYGGYVQSQSEARVITQAAGTYGSTIQRIAVSCGGMSGTGADVRFALRESGTIPITVTVTDSRGRSASKSSAITVLPYREPQVTVREAFRCDEAGEPKGDGLWLKVVFDAAVTVVGDNGAAYRGICTVHGGEDERTAALTDYAGQTTVTGGSFLLTAGIDTAYDCRVEVQDDFCTAVSAAAVVSVGFALIDLCRDTKAVGIGMRASNAGKLSIGMDTAMSGKKVTGLGTPTASSDAATKSYVDGLVSKIYPVGSIYLSTSSTSPASLFGGTWTQIKDRFLLAAGSTYSAGATGGEAKHTLTVSEIPSHYHDMKVVCGSNSIGSYKTFTDNYVIGYLGSFNTYGKELVQYVGGSGAHNNMPPYLAVYMWKRTA